VLNSGYSSATIKNKTIKPIMLPTEVATSSFDLIASILYIMNTNIYIVMVTLGIIMVYKQVKIKQKTDDLIDQCVKSFRYHHPELDEIPISRNKIIYEMANFYLKIK